MCMNLQCFADDVGTKWMLQRYIYQPQKLGML